MLIGPGLVWALVAAYLFRRMKEPIVWTTAAAAAGGVVIPLAIIFALQTTESLNAGLPLHRALQDGCGACIYIGFGVVALSITPVVVVGGLAQRFLQKRTLIAASLRSGVRFSIRSLLIIVAALAVLFAQRPYVRLEPTSIRTTVLNDGVNPPIETTEVLNGYYVLTGRFMAVAAIECAAAAAWGFWTWRSRHATEQGGTNGKSI